MFSYTIDQLPGNRPTIWERLPLQPLAPGPLQAFSYSVLAEVLGRAWYHYYDQMGFTPPLRTRLLRKYKGWAYLNLSESARLEATHAGIEPLTLRINGAAYALADWEKPGLMASLKTGRVQKKMRQTRAAQIDEFQAVRTKARNWHTKTREMKWSQAEILQVMEEIERVNLNSLVTYFAIRHNLELAYNRLLNLTQARLPYPANLFTINNAVCDVDGLVENAMATALVKMAQLVGTDAATVDWLRQPDLHNWREELPHAGLRAAMNEFLNIYGHRCADEGELSTPRWFEDPTPVLRGVLACLQKTPKHIAVMPSAQNVAKVLDAVGEKQKADAQTLLQTIRDLLWAQSHALDAVAFFLAGTRQWALAAGQEALRDARLAGLDDVFHFELEEIKQMMTGEWNISSQAEIRATAIQRREEFLQLNSIPPADLLLGDEEVTSTTVGLPGTAGQVTGPLRRWDVPQPHICNGAVVGVNHLDSGWSLLLPIARGLITATGTPLDPVVAAARQWHTPTILDLGAQYSDLIEGAETTVDVEQVLVDQ